MNMIAMIYVVMRRVGLVLIMIMMAAVNIVLFTVRGIKLRLTLTGGIVCSSVI